MNFNVDTKKLAMDGAFQALGKAAEETEKAYDSLQTIPAKGIRGWLHSGDLKIAMDKYEAKQETQAECQAVFNDAVKAYEEAVLHQGIADAARTEGDQKGRGEVLEAASLILDTEMVAKVGKSATHIIEAKKAVVERASVTIQAQQRRLNAARILGFKA